MAETITATATERPTPAKDADDPTDFSVKPAWRRSFAIAGAVTALALGLYWTPVRTGAEDDLSRKIEYRTRTLLGRSLPLDPRIKMVALEDYTVGALRRPDLGIAEWASVFEFLARNKPRVIFIDRIFGFPIGASSGGVITEAEAARFVSRMKALDVPVVAGAFFQENEIVNRQTMRVDRPEYRLPADVAPFPWLARRTGFAYGPHPSIIDGFAYVGNINYEGNGYIRPLLRVSDQHAMVHSALLTAGALTYDHGAFAIAGHPLPISAEGRLTLNLSDRADYARQTRNLLSILRKINRGESDSWIAKDDVVAVLPMMYTGNTDMKEVPVGRLQGSYVNVTAINNALSGTWLQDVPFGAGAILAFGLLGAVVGNLPLASVFTAVTLAGVLAQVVLGLGLFSFAGRIFPWLFSASAFFLAATSVFIDRARRTERERRRAALKAEEGVRVRQLLHVVCHDIANPLMVVTGRVSMLGGEAKKVSDNAADASGLDKVAHAADRIRRIIEAVRNLEAVETGKVTMRVEAVSLKRIFDATRVSFEDVLAKKDVTIRHDLEGDAPDVLVSADRTGLENFVIYNLVSNAIKFSSAGDTVFLSASASEGKVTIRIRDQGIGMPKDLLERIFSTTKATTRPGTGKERGTGFGMPIVKSYVVRFGGTIAIDSKSIDDSPADHGTEVAITLNQAAVGLTG